MLRSGRRTGALILLSVVSGGTVQAQQPYESPPTAAAPDPFSAAPDQVPPPPSSEQAPTFQPPQMRPAEQWLDGAYTPSVAPQQHTHQFSAECAPEGGFFGGAEFLWIRPHFSEAVAFARGTQTLTTFHTEAEPLDFDYDESFRVFAGYQSGNGTRLEFTYWNLQAETSVGGSAQVLGQFIVDPFGNIVGVAVDPATRAVLVGGDVIATQASVDLDVYDLEVIKPILQHDPRWWLGWTAGTRIADVDQYYQSIVTTAAGAVVSQGDFSASFTGAGPRLGFEARRLVGEEGNFSLFAETHGSLLVGDYEVESSVSPVPGFRASQAQSMTRLIPVMEAEVGAAWHVGDAVTLSAGWTFQAWFDLGTSGGQFAGLFNGADDANIMSFDGLFLRAQVGF